MSKNQVFRPINSKLQIQVKIRLKFNPFEVNKVKIANVKSNIFKSLHICELIFGSCFPICLIFHRLLKVNKPPRGLYREFTSITPNYSCNSCCRQNGVWGLYIRKNFEVMLSKTPESKIHLFSSLIFMPKKRSCSLSQDLLTFEDLEQRKKRSHQFFPLTVA